MIPDTDEQKSFLTPSSNKLRLQSEKPHHHENVRIFWGWLEVTAKKCEKNMKVLSIFAISTEACQPGEDGNLCQNQADARLAECIVTCGYGFHVTFEIFQFFIRTLISNPQKGWYWLQVYLPACLCDRVWKVSLSKWMSGRVSLSRFRVSILDRKKYSPRNSLVPCWRRRYSYWSLVLKFSRKLIVSS